MIIYHPKSALYMLQQKSLFDQKAIEKISANEYKYAFVYRVPAYEQLRGFGFEETSGSKKLTDLQRFRKIASCLA